MPRPPIQPVQMSGSINVVSVGFDREEVSSIGSTIDTDQSVSAAGASFQDVLCGNPRRRSTNRDAISAAKNPRTTVDDDMTFAHWIHSPGVLSCANGGCGGASITNHQGNDHMAHYTAHGSAEIVHVKNDADVTFDGNNLTTRRGSSWTNHPDMDVYVATQQRAFDSTLRARQRLLDYHRSCSALRLSAALSRADLCPPEPYPATRVNRSTTTFLLDRNKQAVYSEFVRCTRISLPDFVRLLRNENPSDPRPNKPLDLPDHLEGWSSYCNRRQWEEIVRHGVILCWTRPFSEQKDPPLNHGSLQEAMNSVLKALRDGQDNGQYLILDISVLKDLEGVTCSPATKGEAPLSQSARTIHDLSFPERASVNDHTDASIGGDINYDGAATLARRILNVQARFPGRVKMMSGDVAGAFRHIPVHADHVGRFAGVIRELGVLVIDLACPFGLTDSPRQYRIAGGAIKHIHAAAYPRWMHQPRSAAEYFDSNAWCDDHNLIEPDVGSRTAEANLSLRRAMIGVLGPESMNEEKITYWFEQGRALGLRWNLRAQTISMPETGIAKASRRISALAGRKSTTRKQMRQLLGSLRHITTCIQAAAPFLQRLADIARTSRRSWRIPVDEGVRDDLHWFQIILSIGQLHSIPLARYIESQPVDVDINMDASDFGLCALFPTRREFLQVQFNEEERSQIELFNADASSNYGINVRELMSAVFASVAWSHLWASSENETQRHIRFWIDNQSAVAWNNRRASRNPLAQLLLRLLSLFEVQQGYYCSAAHIRGVDNVMADAGSRVWQSRQLASDFANFSVSWTQVVIPNNYRNLWRLWEQFYELGPLPTLQGLSISGLGTNGVKLGAFAVYLWQFGMNKALPGNTYSTIWTKLSGVRWYHRNNAGYDPGVSASHAILLRGIRRFTIPVTKQHPVSATLLWAQLDLSHARDQLLWGGILLAHFFLLRRSEYLFIGRRHHAYVLKLGCIKFFDNQGIRTAPRNAQTVGIMLSGAKNNHFGRQENRYHRCSGDLAICRVAAARWIVTGARSFGTRNDQPPLSTGGVPGISFAEVSSAIKAAAKNTQQDAGQFSTHSIRIGGATALLNAGADRLTIKLMGRWLSNAFEEYPVLTAQGSAHLSTLMC